MPSNPPVALDVKYDSLGSASALAELRATMTRFRAELELSFHDAGIIDPFW